MKKWLVSMFMLISLISILAACSNNNNEGASEETNGNENSNNGPVTVNFWHTMTGKNGERIQEMVDRFNSSQAEVEVVATYQGGYDELTTKLQQAIASNTAPDVAVIERAYVEMFAESEVLADLSGFLESSSVISEEDFVEGLMGHSYFNDQLLALPIYRSTPILHVNKTLLEEVGSEVPTNWAELKEVTNKLVVKNGNTIERYGLTMPYDTWYPIAMIGQSGGQFFTDDKTSVGFVDNGIGQEVFEYLTDLQSTGALYYPPQTDSGSIANQMFIEGKVGLMFQSTGTIGNLQDNVDFEYVTAFLPQNDQYSTPTGGGNFAMLDGSQNKEAAWKFMEWVVSDAGGAQQYVIETGYLPFTTKMAESPEIQELWAAEPNRKVAFEQLQYAEDTNKSTKWPTVMHEFFAAIEAIMYDGEDIKSTLETFKEAAELNLN